MILKVDRPSDSQRRLNSAPVFMTVAEVSTALGLSHSQVCRLINEDVFTVAQFGSKTRYVTTDSVSAWLKQFIQADDKAEQPPQTAPKPLLQVQEKVTPHRPSREKFDIPNEMRAQARRIALLANENVLSEDDLNSLIRSLMVWAWNIDEILQRWQAKNTAELRRDEAVESARVAVAKKLVAENIDANFNPHGMFVYILWGDDDSTPVYVGQSTNVLSRLGSHLGDREKRGLVRRIQLIRCATHNEMNNTELRLIREYQPLLNKAGIEKNTRNPAGAA